MICDLWHNGTNSVHDMRVVNTDAKSYLTKTLERCLQDAAKAKKMSLEACFQKRQQVLPFFKSIDGLLGFYAEASLKRISIQLATK